MPSDLFAKKITLLVMKLLIAVDSKFKNDAATSPSWKKYVLKLYTVKLRILMRVTNN